MSLLVSPLQTFTDQRSFTPCLLQYANDNRLHQRFNDLTIQCGTTNIEANSMVLSCYCSYFEQILSNQTNDQQNKPVIQVEDLDGESLTVLIEYIYTGHLRVDHDNVLGILSAADRLELNEVKNFCFKILEECLTPDNCMDVLITAKQYKNFELRDKIYEYMSKNYQAMIQTPAFETFDGLEFVFIVYHLKARFTINDEVLCRSLLSWTKHDEEKRAKYLHRMMKCLNIDKLSYWFIKYALTERLILENRGENRDENRDVVAELNLRFDLLKTKETNILSVGHFCSEVKEVYSLNDKTNDVYPDLPIQVEDNQSLMLNKFVYCIGGMDYSFRGGMNIWVPTNKMYRLNLNENNMKWEELETMLTRRYLFGAAVFNNNLVVFGGRTTNPKEILFSSEVYDSDLNKWNKAVPLKQPRYGNKSVTSGGCLYTMGGCADRCLSSVERLNGLDKSWTFVSSMQTERCRFAVACCDDIIYAIGGLNQNKDILGSVEKYDCIANKWTYVADLNIKRQAHSACVLRGKIFVLGGMKGKSQTVREIECYDAFADKWEIVGNTDDSIISRSLVVV